MVIAFTADAAGGNVMQNASFQSCRVRLSTLCCTTLNFFDDKHVFVTSVTTAEPHVTKIGDVTESRLYSFGLGALEHHPRRVAVAAG